MTRKKNDKKMPRLEPQFHDVLVCKKNDCRPFLEILVEEPENISHQNLGILAGIFQIDDRSEDSSYVVNYLISIIKKEYFSRANRGPVENFESALHKANLALAKLASHENIGWIGRINAICAVIEKNNLLLSQTGNATVLLLRGNSLMELTELPDENIDSNPLKTFQDVISGKIEKNDKLIITTKEIFDIFSPEEIKKSALKFSRENFTQFLNTALINELDQLATLVIDIAEKVEDPIEVYAEKKIGEVNVFSQTAFRKDAPTQAAKKEKVKENFHSEEGQEILKEIKGDGKDFVDKKTGHIYIKEPADLPAETSSVKTKIDFSPLWEKISDLTSFIAKSLVKTGVGMKTTAISFGQKSSSKIAEIRARKKMAILDALEQKIKTQLEAESKIETSTAKEETETKIETPTEQEQVTPLMEKFRATYAQLELKSKTIVFLKKTKTGTDWAKERMIDFLVLILQKPTRLTLNLTQDIKNRWQKNKTEKLQTNSEIADEKRYPWEAISANSAQTEKQIIDNSDAPTPEKGSSPASLKVPVIIKSIELKKFLPDISRLKEIVGKLNQRQKIYALMILLFLLIVPYFIANWESKPKEDSVVIEEAPAIVVPLEKDLNVIRIEKLDEVYAGNISKLLNLNDEFFALSEEEIIDLANKKGFSLPSDFQNPDLFVSMPDLKSIFLIKNEQIISFSPVTGKFQAVKLNFPQNGKIVDAKTYLTYIYLLDVNNNQIYRVPRAEGGFGENKPWIKDSLDLSDAKNIAINENIFVISGQNILKLFKNKKQDFSIENTATPIVPDRLYAKNSDTTIYVLDKTNARIIKLDNEGKIIAQYHNSGIKDASDFSVSEENNLIYLSGQAGVKSFRMQ